MKRATQPRREKEIEDGEGNPTKNREREGLRIERRTQLKIKRG